MNESLKNIANLSKEHLPDNTCQKPEQQSLETNKNNWTNGLVILNELDTSDEEDSSIVSSSSSSGDSHSTTHNSAVISGQNNYYKTEIVNNSNTCFSEPKFKQADTVYYLDSKTNFDTKDQNSSSNSSCNSKLSKSTTKSNFSMEQDDQDRDSCRSDDTDSPVGPPAENKRLPAPQMNSSSFPNYVNVTKDVDISEVCSDSGTDDIKSGKVIGANLSDEGNDDDSFDNRQHNVQNRNSRENHLSR